MKKFCSLYCLKQVILIQINEELDEVLAGSRKCFYRKGDYRPNRISIVANRHRRRGRRKSRGSRRRQRQREKKGLNCYRLQRWKVVHGCGVAMNSHKSKKNLQFLFCCPVLNIFIQRDKYLATCQKV